MSYSYRPIMMLHLQYSFVKDGDKRTVPLSPLFGTYGQDYEYDYDNDYDYDYEYDYEGYFVAFRCIPVHSGAFRCIPVHFGAFRCARQDSEGSGANVNFLCLPIAIGVVLRYNSTDNRLVIPICEKHWFGFDEKRNEVSYGELDSDHATDRIH